MNNKSLLSAFFIAVILSGLVLINTMSIGSVGASTEVSGMINSDTTWTAVNSPFSLAGPVTVSSGVNLTVEAGVTVNLNGYKIQVNGILYARGSSAENIVFNSDPAGSEGIVFATGSTSWNEQTGTGCIIENSVLDSVSISVYSTSPKISNNTITASANAIDGSAIFTDTGAPVISQNIIEGDIENLNSAAPIITNNTITGGIYGMGALTSSPIITHNNITGGSQKDFLWNGCGITCGGSSIYVADNIVYNCITGINAFDGSSIIERNILCGSNYGITVGGVGSTVSSTLRNNTIAYNEIGIYVSPSYLTSINSLTVSGNNIHNNSDNTVRLANYATKDVDAAYNWWGANDAEAINQSIYDFKNDNNLGNVTFTPFLNEPNPKAPEIPESIMMLIQIPTPTPTPLPTAPPQPTASPSPSPIPDQSYFFVKSNSTVSELFFNSTSSELSFTVTGPSGTWGYVEVTVSKSLVSSIQDVKVYLDGSQLNVAITEDEDAWLLYFTYTHSTHDVLVSLAGISEVGVESLVWFASAFVVGVLVAVSVAYMCKRKGSQGNSLVVQNRRGVG